MSENKESKKLFYLKKIIILKIKETIKDNPNIKSDELVAKLSVNPPYLSEKYSLNTIKNLLKDKQIKIDEEDRVNLCQ